MSKPLKLVFFSFMIWGLAEGCFIYFLPLDLELRGATPIQVGSILGAAGLGLALSHLPSGILTDRFGPKRLMVLGTILGTAATYLMYRASSLQLFAFAVIAYHISALVVSALDRYLVMVRGSWSLTRAITFVSAAYGLGLIFGPVIGGQIAERWGLTPTYGLAVLLEIVASALIFFLPNVPLEAVPSGPRYQSLMRNSRFGMLLLLVVFGNFALYLGWPLTPNFLVNFREVQLSDIGAFGSLNALGGVLFNLAAGGMAIVPALLGAQILVFGSAILFLGGSGLPAYAAGYLLVAGLRAYRPVIISITEKLVSDKELGMAFGLAETANGLVYTIAPPIAGLLYAQRPDVPYILSLLLIGVGILTTLVSVPRLLKQPSSLAVEIHPAAEGD